MIDRLSDDLHVLLERIFELNPQKRIKANEIINSPWLQPLEQKGEEEVRERGDRRTNE